MKIDASSGTYVHPSPIFTFVILIFLSGCTHSIADTRPDLIGADKKCSSQTWPNKLAEVNCYASIEAPVIKRDAPVVMTAYEKFSSNRKLLAQKYDDENTPAVEDWNQFKQKIYEANAVLVAHEPQEGDKDSTLNKDFLSANLGMVCTSQVFADRAKCFYSIERPIWERDAPDTIKYYDEYQKKRLELSKRYDASGGKIHALADDHYRDGMKQAADEFWSDARPAIQQQQAAETQSSAENAQDTAQALSVIGQLIQGFAQGYATGAQARVNAAPVAMQTIQPLPTITHTNCQMVFNQWQCTNTPY